MNNFEQIEGILNFENGNDFYFLNILKRRKDNPDMVKDVKVIKSFYINSLQELQDIKDRIISICDEENARAYIRLNRRNHRHISVEILKHFVSLIKNDPNTYDVSLKSVIDITQLISENKFDDIKHYIKSLDYKRYDSICGSSPCDKDKTWIVDIDYVEGELGSKGVKTEPWDIDEINELLIKLQSETKKEPLMLKIPTKNGYHLITRPFNLQTFGDQYRSRIDVHKDNPTLLYCK